MSGSNSQTQETDYRALVDSQSTLLLATCCENGDADLSYAPYLLNDEIFYIYVSELARHTGNLLRNRQASVMFIQPEDEADSLFARQRLVLNCRITEIDRDEPNYSLLLDAMQDKFGGIVGVLRSLPDFHLLALTPIQGQYVAGFGKTFAVEIGDAPLSP